MFQKTEDVWCIIPARGGSKGIPLKNVYPLCGKPLIAYSIEYARSCSGVSRVVVSTDSEKIAEVAEEYGAWVPELRPAELSTDTANLTDAYWHGVDSAVEKLSLTPRKIIVLYPTSPFRPPFLLNEAIDELESAVVYKVCQIIRHSRGYYNRMPDGSMRRIYSGGGLKQMGLAFGIRYLPPGCRPYPETYPAFQEYLKTMRYKGGGTSLRVIDTNFSPWAIDIDCEEDIALAEWYIGNLEAEETLQKFKR